MAITPLVLVAGKGLLEDTALGVNSDLQNTINNYAGINWVSQWKGFVETVEADLYNASTNPLGMPQSTIDNFTFLFDSMPWVVDTIPKSYISSKTYISDYIIQQANNIGGNGSNGVLAQNILIANGYRQSLNSMIQASANGADLVQHTFTSMDELTTGNLSRLSSDLVSFGADLTNTGKLFDFSLLDKFGTPNYLMERLVNVNALGFLGDEFDAVGLDVYELSSVILENSENEMKLEYQKQAYDIFTTIKDEKLLVILDLLEVNITGIAVLSDLLNLIKVFPNSYGSLRGVDNQLIYNSGTIATFVSNISTPFGVVMPIDQIQASLAFKSSLLKIKDIHKTTPEKIATQAVNIETNDGLNDIIAQTQAVPADVLSYYSNDIGGGTGSDGIYLLTDLIGSIIGEPHTLLISDMINNLYPIQNDFITQFQKIFDVGYTLMAGGYLDPMDLNPDTVTVPYGLPASGTYANRAEAMNQLYLHSVNVVSGLYATYQVGSDVQTQNVYTILDHINLELEILDEAGIRFLNTLNPVYNAPSTYPSPSPRKQTTISFAQNIPNYGLDTEMNAFLEKLVLNTTEGQALLGALREGRNSKRIADAGITPENKLG